MMIGITISGKAYAVLGPTLPTGSAVEGDLDPDREYQIWLPQDVVERLIALREQTETFSGAILRLAECGSLTTMIQ